MNSIVSDFFEYSNDPHLPLDEMREILASIRGRINPKLERDITRLIEKYNRYKGSVIEHFPAQKIIDTILKHLATVPAKAHWTTFEFCGLYLPLISTVNILGRLRTINLLG